MILTLREMEALMKTAWTVVGLVTAVQLARLRTLVPTSGSWDHLPGGYSIALVRPYVAAMSG